jgi:hypothetical protein
LEDETVAYTLHSSLKPVTVKKKKTVNSKIQKKKEPLDQVQV